MVVSLASELGSRAVMWDEGFRAVILLPSLLSMKSCLDPTARAAAPTRISTVKQSIMRTSDFFTIISSVLGLKHRVGLIGVPRMGRWVLACRLRPQQLSALLLPPGSEVLKLTEWTYYARNERGHLGLTYGLVSAPDCREMRKSRAKNWSNIKLIKEGVKK